MLSAQATRWVSNKVNRIAIASVSTFSSPSKSALTRVLVFGRTIVQTAASKTADWGAEQRAAEPSRSRPVRRMSTTPSAGSPSSAPTI